jgi:hypothetical protein
MTGKRANPVLQNTMRAQNVRDPVTISAEVPSPPCALASIG